MTSVGEPGGDRRERHDLVRRMRAWLDATQRGDEYDVEVLGAGFTVLPGVFSPRFYSETEFYAEHVLAALRPGERFLDVGCGIGVNATLAAARGVRVVACDISPAAIENTRRNARRHDVAIDVRESDVFSAIDADERFDVVYWNIPFTFCDPQVRLTPLEEAIFDPGFRKHTAFLTQVCDHLEPGGLVLIGVSSSLGDLPAIDTIADGAGLVLELRATTIEMGSDPPVHLELLAARPG